jgi:pimeloyl-ACP methyl ester carboxylesterase
VSHAQARSLAERSLASRVAVPATGQRGFARRVRLPGGRRIYLTCRGHGRPAVILESGLGNGADVWGGPFLAASSDPPAAPQRAVLPAVARFTRVCAYDRPGTSLLDTRTGRWPPGRSDPVAMPRTALDIARDLHTLLRQASTLPAAHLRGPYVLVGHSVGGLGQCLYATLHPRQTAGLVLVDATPPDYAATLAHLLAQGRLTREQYAAVAEQLPPRAWRITAPTSDSISRPAGRRCARRRPTRRCPGCPSSSSRCRD